MKVTTLEALPTTKSTVNPVAQFPQGTYFKFKQADHVYIKTSVNTVVCLTPSFGVSFPISAFGDGTEYEKVTLEELVLRRVL